MPEAGLTTFQWSGCRQKAEQGARRRAPCPTALAGATAGLPGAWLLLSLSVSGYGGSASRGSFLPNVHPAPAAPHKTDRLSRRFPVGRAHSAANPHGGGNQDRPSKAKEQLMGVLLLSLNLSPFEGWGKGSNNCGMGRPPRRNGFLGARDAGVRARRQKLRLRGS